MYHILSYMPTKIVCSRSHSHIIFRTCLQLTSMPNAMSPIYFHGNFNRYKEQNNAVWWRKFPATKHKTFFNIVTIIISLAQMRWLRCSSFYNVTVFHDHPEHNFSFMSLLPPLSNPCSLTALISTIRSSKTFGKCPWMLMSAIFSVWRNSVPHFFFICTSMSDTILSDCLSAAIYRTTAKWMEYWWECSL